LRYDLRLELDGVRKSREAAMHQPNRLRKLGIALKAMVLPAKKTV
jgi:hypothetical protein